MLKLTFLIAFLVLSFQNCAQNVIEKKPGQKVTLQEKEDAIESRMLSSVPNATEIGNDLEFSVWTATDNDSPFIPAAGEEFNYPEFYVNVSAAGEVETNSIAVNRPVSVGAKRYCAKPSSNYPTLQSAKAVTFKVARESGEVLCQSSDMETIKNKVNSLGLLEAMDCNATVSGEEGLFVSLKNENGKSLIVNKSGHKRLDDPWVKFKLMDNKVVNVGDTLNVMNAVRGESGMNCDQTASPLVIDFRQNTRSLFQLTSPEDGVHFDILGSNSYPQAHEPIKISWLRSKDVGFLVLPDETGEVRGIDELFGDNTMGPDGRTAENGFHALQKYDGLDLSYQGVKLDNTDFFIDENDDVFHFLRIWMDRNFDGRVQRSELSTLDQMGIESIDLRYDPRFREVDQFGNELRFKSLVHMKNGEMLLIFDIWFNYNQ